MDNLAHTDESIHLVYESLDLAYSQSDYPLFLTLLSQDHETIHADERRVTRQELDETPFPFDGVRDCQTLHTILSITFARSGCTVLTECSSLMTLGGKKLQEDLILLDLWRTDERQWRLRRRIVMRQKRQATGFFSLVEHPIYCQFGHCRNEKSTWKDPRSG